MTDFAARPAASWRDFYQMCKPRVVMLMLLTALAGMHLAAPGMAPANAIFFGSLGIALVAASGAVVNHLVDRRIDRLMRRTRRRPLPEGRVEPAHAAVFAAALGLAGMALLLWRVNPLCAWLTLASFVGYAVVYTGYLKHATPQNIVIGGLSGATPPLLGWSAVTGTVEPGALMLVLIIFVWTPPHFWALAIHRRDDYANSGVPMLPVTHGERVARIHIAAYTALLLAASVLPWLTGMSGPPYLAAALILGAGFMAWSLKLLLRPAPGTAMGVFRYSIWYLALLFAALLVDHSLP